MRAFVLVDKSGLSQSLYTKYLLKHLQTQESVGSLFEQLNCSFTRNEDASIVAKMKPEYKDSTRQKFSLSAPLRQSSASKLHKEFFKYCRIEPMAPNFEDYMQCSLGLCWNQESNWYVLNEKKTQLYILLPFYNSKSHFQSKLDSRKHLQSSRSSIEIVREICGILQRS